MTGVIDQATWLDPSDSLPGGFTLNQIDGMFADESNGVYPDDNVVPEPGTLGLLFGGGGFAAAVWAVRRRRTKHNLGVS